MSSPRGADVAAAARGWIGTPYLHQSSTKGAGTDCLGLLRGIWREIVGAEPEVIPPYTRDWSEPAREERLWAAAMRHLVPLRGTEPKGPGEVLLFRMRAGSVAKHLGISGRIPTYPDFVPLSEGRAQTVPPSPGGPDFGRNGRDPARPGRPGVSRGGTAVLPVGIPYGGGATFIHAYSGHAVVESPLSTPWRRRIVARFAFPEGDI